MTRKPGEGEARDKVIHSVCITSLPRRGAGQESMTRKKCVRGISQETQGIGPVLLGLWVFPWHTPWRSVRGKFCTCVYYKNKGLTRHGGTDPWLLHGNGK